MSEKKATKSKGKTEKVEFKDVMEGDKLSIKCDVEVTSIQDLDDYLKVSDERKVHKVGCLIKSGPFKDREAHFVILDDDKVSLHKRPSLGKRFWKFWFGSKKGK
jgi:hypothetical protein